MSSKSKVRLQVCTIYAQLLCGGPVCKLTSPSQGCVAVAAIIQEREGKADFSLFSRRCPTDQRAGIKRGFWVVPLVLDLITCRSFHGVRRSFMMTSKWECGAESFLCSATIKGPLIRKSQLLLM